MLGAAPLPVLDMSKKRSHSSAIKIVKRDSRSVKLVRFLLLDFVLTIVHCYEVVSNSVTVFDQRLGVGGTAEKIVSALHTVQSEQADEGADLEKCKTSMRHVGKMEKDVNSACRKGNSCFRPESNPAFLLSQ